MRRFVGFLKAAAMRQNGKVDSKDMVMVCIYMVVSFLSVLIHLRHIIYLIMISTSELVVGDSDFYVFKSGAGQTGSITGSSFKDILTSNFIEVKEFEEKMKGVDSVMGTSPRYILPGTCSNLENKKSTDCQIIIGDSIQEMNFGIGRGLETGMLSEKQAIVTTGIKNMIELEGEEGKTNIQVRLALVETLRSIGVLKKRKTDLINNNTVLLDIEDRYDITELIKANLPDTLRLNISVDDVLKSLGYPTSLKDNEERYELLVDIGMRALFFLENISEYLFKELDDYVKIGANKIEEEIIDIIDNLLKSYVSGSEKNFTIVFVDYLDLRTNLKEMSSWMRRTAVLKASLLARVDPTTSIGTLLYEVYKEYLFKSAKILVNKEIQKLVDLGLVELEKNRDKLLSSLREEIEKLERQYFEIETKDFIYIFVDFAMKAFTYKEDFLVVQFTQNSKGKWPDVLGNVVFIDGKYFFKNYRDIMVNNWLEVVISDVSTKLIESHLDVGKIDSREQRLKIKVFSNDLITPVLKKQVDELLISRIRSLIEEFDPTNMSILMCVVVKNKLEVYNSFNSYKSNLISVSNDVQIALEDFGAYKIVSYSFDNFSQFGLVFMFFINILNLIILFLIVISVAMLFSIIFFGVNHDTHQYGVYRVLGMPLSWASSIIIIKYAICCSCGWCLGIIASWMIITGLDLIFHLNMRLDNKNYPREWTTYGITLFFGLVLPLSLVIFSSRKVFGRLVEALRADSRSNTGQAIFIKLDKLGISGTALFSSLIMISFGAAFLIITAYFVSISRLDFVLYIFSSLAICSIVALTIMGSIVQTTLQIIVGWVLGLFLGRKRKQMMKLVYINFDTHSKTNRTIGIVISLLVCFSIYSGSGLSSQIKYLVGKIISSNGSDLKLETAEENGILKEQTLRKILERNENKELVESYSFVTSDFNTFPFVNSISVTSQLFYPFISNAKLLGVDQNYSLSMFEDYYSPVGFKDKVKYNDLPGGKIDGMSALFQSAEANSLRRLIDPFGIITGNFESRDTEGYGDSISMNAVISTGLSDLLSLGAGSVGLVNIDMSLRSVRSNLNIVHTADLIPGFSFSQYPSSSKSEPIVVVSIDDYVRILEIISNQTSDQADTLNMQDYLAQDWTPDEPIEPRHVPKNRLLVKMKPDVSDAQRDVLKNTLKSQLDNDDSLVDAIELSKIADYSKLFMKYLDYCLSSVTSVIAFFMMVVLMSKKMKDNLKEMVVLRCIGLSVNQLHYIYHIETISVLLSSVCVGTCIGVLSAFMNNYILYIYFEFKIPVQYNVLSYLLVVGYLGASSLVCSVVSIRSYISHDQVFSS